MPEFSVDITSAGRVVASLVSSAKLTQWLQETHVVHSNEILRQTHYGRHQSCLEVLSID